ncbi:hypothetical protein CYMTET_19866 [Cymbomonas tetramitiformis]|uniref:SSD domain-containing protein n=1 Tax=Cymbomonas tetramitiformis TaxID=36881 RepID=A0AAE0G556_9CHLO|nr:hypothetical protein CYMTET_19866 [Cymbomonas tetramitiformis]
MTGSDGVGGGPPLCTSEASDDTVHVYFGGEAITEYEVLHVLYGDVALSCISLVLVTLFMLAHTGSWFITFAGMFEILISFPVAYFFYRVVLGIPYAGMLNFASLFIILGIGVDDVFVFFDTYQQLRRDVPVMEQRILATYHKAGKAMFITSFTTAAAFLANLTSIIPALRHFGLFLAILVIANYALAMTWFPCTVAFWDSTLGGGFEPAGNPLRHCWARLKAVCLPRPRGDYNSLAAGEADADEYLAAPVNSLDPVELSSFEMESMLEAPADSHPAWWDSVWCRFSEAVHVARWGIIAGTVALVVVSLAMASLLQPTRDLPKFFPEGSNLQEFLDLSNDQFLTVHRCPNCMEGIDEVTAASVAKPSSFSSNSGLHTLAHAAANAPALPFAAPPRNPSPASPPRLPPALLQAMPPPVPVSPVVDFPPAAPPPPSNPPCPPPPHSPEPPRARLPWPPAAPSDDACVAALEEVLQGASKHLCIMGMSSQSSYCCKYLKGQVKSDARTGGRCMAFAREHVAAQPAYADLARPMLKACDLSYVLDSEPSSVAAKNATVTPDTLGPTTEAPIAYAANPSPTNAFATPFPSSPTSTTTSVPSTDGPAAIPSSTSTSIPTTAAAAMASPTPATPLPKEVTSSPTPVTAMHPATTLTARPTTAPAETPTRAPTSTPLQAPAALAVHAQLPGGTQLVWRCAEPASHQSLPYYHLAARHAEAQPDATWTDFRTVYEGAQCHFWHRGVQPGVVYEYRVRQGLEKASPEAPVSDWSTTVAARGLGHSPPGHFFTLLQSSLHSDELQVSCNVSVLLPPAYNTSRRYPVVYFLGTGETPPGSPQEMVPSGEFVELVRWVLGKLHETHTREAQLIAVVSETATGKDTSNTASQHFGSFLRQELVPWVDSEYATKGKRSARGLSGFGMGAYGSLVNGLEHMELFRAAAAHSAPLDLRTVVDSLQEHLTDAKQNRPSVVPHYEAELQALELAFSSPAAKPLSATEMQSADAVMARWEDRDLKRVVGRLPTVSEDFYLYMDCMPTAPRPAVDTSAGFGQGCSDGVLPALLRADFHQLTPEQMMATSVDEVVGLRNMYIDHWNRTELDTLLQRLLISTAYVARALAAPTMAELFPSKPPSENMVWVTLLWGVRGIDRSHVDRNNPFAYASPAACPCARAPLPPSPAQTAKPCIVARPSDFPPLLATLPDGPASLLFWPLCRMARLPSSSGHSAGWSGFPPLPATLPDGPASLLL